MKHLKMVRYGYLNRPKLHDNMYTFEDIEDKPTLLDHEICFDAPNIVRVGTDLLYQVSNSGNMKGFKWLKRLLEPMGYKLHYSELYSFAHFDSTIIPLRPGLSIAKQFKSFTRQLSRNVCKMG